MHYHFTDKETMEKEIARGSFIESANVHGNFYGTSKVIPLQRVGNDLLTSGACRRDGGGS